MEFSFNTLTAFRLVREEKVVGAVGACRRERQMV